MKFFILLVFWAALIPLIDCGSSHLVAPSERAMVIGRRPTPTAPAQTYLNRRSLPPPRGQDPGTTPEMSMGCDDDDDTDDLEAFGFSLRIPAYVETTAEISPPEPSPSFAIPRTSPRSPLLRC